METLQSSKGELWLTAIKAYISCNCYWPSFSLHAVCKACQRVAPLSADLNAQSSLLCELALTQQNLPATAADTATQSNAELLSVGIFLSLPYSCIQFHSKGCKKIGIYKKRKRHHQYGSLSHTTTPQKHDQQYLEDTNRRNNILLWIHPAHTNSERAATKWTVRNTHWRAYTHGIQSKRLLFIIVACLLGCRANPFSWQRRKESERKEWVCFLPVLWTNKGYF